MFILGSEESHGYLVGQYARDKDGAVACLLMAELAAQLKADGKIAPRKAGRLFWQHGVQLERLITLQMEGSEGMAECSELMSAVSRELRRNMGGDRVAAVRDYLNSCITREGVNPAA